MLHFFGPGETTNYFLVFISNRYINNFVVCNLQKGGVEQKSRQIKYACVCIIYIIKIIIV